MCVCVCVCVCEQAAGNVYSTLTLSMFGHKTVKLSVPLLFSKVTQTFKHIISLCVRAHIPLFKHKKKFLHFFQSRKINSYKYIKNK